MTKEETSKKTKVITNYTITLIQMLRGVATNRDS